jgi:hypothetical protein
MTFKSFASAGLFLLTCASAAYAADPIDVSRLPLDRVRIHHALQQSTIHEQRIGLNLKYAVNVYAPAPQIRLFTKEDNLVNGPVPYGAPTHHEMIEHVTPQEYRAPPADLSTVFRWLLEQAKNK